MVLVQADDPADGMLDVVERLRMHVEGDAIAVHPSDVGTRRLRHDVAMRSFGRWICLSNETIHYDAGVELLGAFEQAIVLFATENRGCCELALYEWGVCRLRWEELMEHEPGSVPALVGEVAHTPWSEIEHPIVEGIGEDVHPFDRIQEVCRRLVGASPTELTGDGYWIGLWRDR